MSWIAIIVIFIILIILFLIKASQCIENCDYSEEEKDELANNFEETFSEDD